MLFLTIFLGIRIKPGCALKEACILERGLEIGHHWQRGPLDLFTHHICSLHCVSVARSSKREKDKKIYT